MGSSRRFNTTDIKLQKALRQQDSRYDASQIGSPTVGDQSTRFDFERKKDAQTRRELDEKREVCFHLNNRLTYKFFILGSNKSLERSS